MKRGRKPSKTYLAMMSDLRNAYEERRPYQKKFTEWAYEFDVSQFKVKSYQLKVRMELAKEDIPVVPLMSQSKRGRFFIDGLEIAERNEEGQAKVDGDGVRDIKAIKGKAVNVIIRQTARVNSDMLPPSRRAQHKRLIGRQAGQFVKLLEETTLISQK